MSTIPDNELFTGDPEIESFEFEPSQGASPQDEPEFSGFNDPPPLKEKPSRTAAQSAKGAIVLYESALSRILAAWADGSHKEYKFEPEERDELEGAAAAYFETTSAEIPPGVLFLFSLLVISGSIAIRAHKDRGARKATKEQIKANKAKAEAKKQQDEELQAVAREMIQALPERPKPTLKPFVFSENDLEDEPVKDRVRFEFCQKRKCFYYGNSENDPNGAAYRDPKNQSTWIPAPPIIQEFTKQQKAKGVKTAGEINQAIIDQGIWRTAQGAL